jgi:AraC family transcriptional regulator, arabinose operon regulatory protein
MLQDAPFSLLAGGLYRCDPSWDKAADGIDQCYKLYLPIRGQARLTLNTQDIALRPGRAYLIPGHHLVRQECLRRMDVYWLHFVPESLPLSLLLSHITRVHPYDGRALEYWRPTCKELPRLFEDGSRGLFHRVQAMLMDLVAQVLETYSLGHVAAVDPVFERLKPAITFMDQHLLENPRLADIAKTVHLAPNYFHRKFTGTFRVTPFAYMLERRMHLGRQLLLSTNLKLAGIAERCGFYSEFHFSKLFKKHCGMSPRQFRSRSLP